MPDVYPAQAHTESEQPEGRDQLGRRLRVRGTTLECSWGHSSAGRALRWHRRGRRFEPGWLHFGSFGRWLVRSPFRIDPRSGRAPGRAREECWRHILARHPELALYLADIARAVREPDRRLPGRHDGEEFYLEGAGPVAGSRWSCDFGPRMDRGPRLAFRAGTGRRSREHRPAVASPCTRARPHDPGAEPSTACPAAPARSLAPSADPRAQPRCSPRRRHRPIHSRQTLSQLSYGPVEVPSSVTRELTPCAGASPRRPRPRAWARRSRGPRGGSTPASRA